MDRPKEYDNLIKAGAFAEITPEPAAVQARILRAKGYLEYAQYGAQTPAVHVPLRRIL